MNFLANQEREELLAVCAEAKEAAEQAKMEFQELSSEFEHVAKSLNELQDQNVRLLQQLGDRDDVNTQLVTEGLKHKQIEKLLESEKKALQDRLRITDAELKTQSSLVQRLDEQSQQLITQLQRMEASLGRTTVELAEARSAWIASEASKQVRASL
jgi:chromosome segregation ATPase